MIECLVAILLVFMPLAFGVVHAWSEEVVVVLSSAILIVFTVKLIVYDNVRLVRTWAYLPIVVFLLICVLQLMPLPAGVLEIISPSTVALRRDLPAAVGEGGFMQISLYPYATRHILRLLLSATAVFAVVINVYRSSRQIKRLLLTIAVIGGVVGAVALGQQLIGNTRIYWLIACRNTEGYSGPFVCHSHYGQFMNLSMGAGLSLLCVMISERFASGRRPAGEVVDYLLSRSAWGTWLLIGAISIGAATIFLSLTRGGMISMLASAGFLAVMLARRRIIAGHGWVMVFCGLAAFACVLYVGFDAVCERLASLRDAGAYHDRLHIVRDLCGAFKRFPVFGTGLGTHAVVYPLFKTVNKAALFTHAENEYAQLMEEAGLAGLLTLTFLGVMIWKAYAWNIRRQAGGIQTAAYGLGFGLMAVLIHSFSDFGQHLCANGFLSAVFCALLLNLKGTRKQAEASVEACGRGRIHAVVWTIIFLCVCGVCVWSVTEADNARLAAGQWKKAKDIKNSLAEKGWQGAEREYAGLLEHLKEACNRQPQNVKYGYWYNLCRLYSILGTEEYYDGDLSVSGEAAREVDNIVSELKKTTGSCPVYGPCYSLAGNIQRFVLADEAGEAMIRRGFELSRWDPESCFAAGRLDVAAGKLQDSVSKFRRAVELEAGLFEEVAGIYVTELSRPDMAISAAGDDVQRLKYVAGVLEDMQYDDLAGECYERIVELLQEKCQGNDATAGDWALLASACQKQQQRQKAIEYYRRALAADYSRVKWRYDLAGLLAEMNLASEAIKEARICLRLRPEYGPARRLIAELSVSAGGFEDESAVP